MRGSYQKKEKSSRGKNSGQFHTYRGMNERFEWLIAAGFDDSSARRAAEDMRYDFMQLLDLHDRGCPPELAVRILAPIELEVAQ